MMNDLDGGLTLFATIKSKDSKRAHPFLFILNIFTYLTLTEVKFLFFSIL